MLTPMLYLTYGIIIIIITLLVNVVQMSKVDHMIMQNLIGKDNDAFIN